MFAAILAKMVVSKVIDAIEKADDKRIASNHEKRIKKLERYSHPASDFVCIECGCKAKRVNKKNKRKSK